MNILVRYLGQFHNEVVSVGLTRAFLDLLVAGVLASVTDVLPDCGVEEYGLLTHETDLVSQPANLQVADIVTIYINLK